MKQKMEKINMIENLKQYDVKVLKKVINKLKEENKTLKQEIKKLEENTNK